MEEVPPARFLKRRQTKRDEACEQTGPGEGIRRPDFLAAPQYTILMTRKLILLLALFAGFAAAQGRVYELRTYTCNEGKLDALKARFRDHTIEIFKRHGMESIGYWVPQDGEKSKTTLIYILAHPSREAATQHWKEFSADPEWKKVSDESNANGRIVNHVESVFMDPTDFSKLK